MARPPDTLERRLAPLEQSYKRSAAGPTGESPPASPDPEASERRLGRPATASTCLHLPEGPHQRAPHPSGSWTPNSASPCLLLADPQPLNLLLSYPLAGSPETVQRDLAT